MNAMCFLAMLAACLPSASDPALIVAQDGRAVATIVLPEQPTVTERHAAEELTRYLGRATGATFQVVAENRAASGPCIAVGRTQRLQEAGWKLTGEELGVDGFVLRSLGSGLVICGVNDRGTLYGIYEFLHRFAGCGWYLPGELGEVVPHRDRVEVPPLNETHRPAMEWRGITFPTDLADTSPGGGRDIAEWFVRYRINVLYVRETPLLSSVQAQEKAAEPFWAQRGGIRKRFLNHAWDRALPCKEHFKEHPDWYALVAGKRKSGERAKLCTTNPEVIERVTRDAIEYLREHPDEELFSITESDGLGWCECERCRALDDGRVYATPALDEARKEKAGNWVTPVVTNRMITFTGSTTTSSPRRCGTPAWTRIAL